MPLRRRPARDLRLAVDCMPLATRRAMLEGIEGGRIIVGAYADREGGVCPMLAAHRNGGRTSLASFARAWDTYTGAGRRARPASDRELGTLRAMLEASIALEELPELRPPSRNQPARPAARGLLSSRKRPRAGTGERHRARELRYQPGWAWLRPFRRLDEYERAVAELEGQTSVSPGRMNCSSGTMQAGEVRSR
jgi:hypothetical protein